MAGILTVGGGCRVGCFVSQLEKDHAVSCSPVIGQSESSIDGAVHHTSNEVVPNKAWASRPL